jgi:hypothetical protein
VAAFHALRIVATRAAREDDARVGTIVEIPLFCDDHICTLLVFNTDGRTAMKRSEANHKVNQANPNNKTHQQTRDNLANQRNPQHPAYRQSRDGGQTGNTR